MRYLFLAFVACVVIVSCKKSDGNSAPEIKFKSITSPLVRGSSTGILPLLTIEVKDADGDIGFEDGKDTSYIYIKNITISPFKLDSFKFPSNISAIAKKDFKANVDIDLQNTGTAGSGVLIGSPITRPRPFTDTLYFEVYVKDFAKNKSNVIRTDNPLLFITP